MKKKKTDEQQVIYNTLMLMKDQMPYEWAVGMMTEGITLADQLEYKININYVYDTMIDDAVKQEWSDKYDGVLEVSQKIGWKPYE